MNEGGMGNFRMWWRRINGTAQLCDEVAELRVALANFNRDMRRISDSLTSLGRRVGTALDDKHQTRRYLITAHDKLDNLAGNVHELLIRKGAREREVEASDFDLL